MDPVVVSWAKLALVEVVMVVVAGTVILGEVKF